MKKIIGFIIIGILASCAPAKVTTTGKKPLYEILTQQPDGGASIRFYEILSEPNEIKMLLGDENLKNKIGPNDTTNATFIILNMGEQTSGGHTITVDTVTETPDKIIVTTKDNNPGKDTMNATVMTNPYTIVKINSKKPLEIK